MKVAVEFKPAESPQVEIPTIESMKDGVWYMTFDKKEFLFKQNGSIFRASSLNGELYPTKIAPASDRNYWNLWCQLLEVPRGQIVFTLDVP